MPSLSQLSPKDRTKDVKLRLEGDYQGVIGMTYRPNAVGFDEDDFTHATDEVAVDNPADPEDGKFFRYLVGVIVDWDVEGPVYKEMYRDGRIQSVEVLPAGVIEITPENLRLIGAPFCGAVHAALLEVVMGNRKSSRKR